jgi:hypothetical protein
MERREFIAFLGGAVWPLAARTQQAPMRGFSLTMSRLPRR